MERLRGGGAPRRLCADFLPGSPLAHYRLLDIPGHTPALARPHRPVRRRPPRPRVLPAGPLGVPHPSPASHTRGALRTLARRGSAPPRARGPEILSELQAPRTGRVPDLPLLPHE